MAAEHILGVLHGQTPVCLDSFVKCFDVMLKLYIENVAEPVVMLLNTPLEGSVWHVQILESQSRLSWVLNLSFVAMCP